MCEINRFQFHEGLWDDRFGKNCKATVSFWYSENVRKVTSALHVTRNGRVALYGSANRTVVAMVAARRRAAGGNRDWGREDDLRESPQTRAVQVSVVCGKTLVQPCRRGSPAHSTPCYVLIVPAN